LNFSSRQGEVRRTHVALEPWNEGGNMGIKSRHQGRSYWGIQAPSGVFPLAPLPLLTGRCCNFKMQKLPGKRWVNPLPQASLSWYEKISLKMISSYIVKKHRVHVAICPLCTKRFFENSAGFIILLLLCTVIALSC
jgi:hypothetical protein